MPQKVFDSADFKIEARWAGKGREMHLLSKPAMLWILFVVMLLTGASFGFVSSHWEITLLDSLTRPDVIARELKAYSPGQKEVHIWVTLTLDVIYPLAYGGFFAGLALLAFPKVGLWLAVPAGLTILTDLIEGVVQVLLLSSNDTALIPIKSALTSLKFTFLFVAAFIALIAIGTLVYKRVAGLFKTRDSQ